MWKARRVVGVAVLAAWMFFACALASAQDLTQWNPEGPISFTDGSGPYGVDSTAVVLPNGQMRLYYGSDGPNRITGAIVSATSSDGHNFTPDPGVRLQSLGIGPGQPGSVQPPTLVVPLGNGQYRMFFDTDVTPGVVAGGIGSAISNDGLNFTIEPGVRVPTSAVPSLPSDGEIAGLGIAALPNGTYRMYFEMLQAGPNLNPNYNYSAISSDMLNWTVEPGVRLGPGTAISDSEPNNSAGHPFAMTNGDGSVNVFFTATAYYTGTTNPGEGIAFATTVDGLNFISETLTSVSGSDGVNCMPCGDVTVYQLPNGGLRLYYNNLDMTTGFNTLYSASSVQPSPGAPALVAAVLPSSRSVEVGATATAFATIINAGLGKGLFCQIAPVTDAPITFTYQTTNPQTNAVTGTANTPVMIPAGASQSFVIAVTPTGASAPAEVQISFMCGNGAPAPTNVGLDTLLLSASTTPVPDIVALAASNDPGIVDIQGATGDGDFAVATVNLGAAASITATANTGSVGLPVTLSLCQTNPASGACLAAPSASVTTTIAANATPTFGIFVAGSATVPFDPANNRVFVSFADSGGTVRGSTSVAVRTQ